VPNDSSIATRSGVVVRLLAIGCAVLGVLTVGYAGPMEGPTRLFTGSDLFGLQQALDPQIRPDGSAVAYVRMSHDVMQDRAVHSIWLVDAATGQESPIYSGQGDGVSPRWSPDGKRLAFISRPKEGRAQIYVRWSDSGVIARVTDLTETPSSLVWSPDGTSIAFLMFASDDETSLGQAPPKPEGAQWAEPLEVITDVTYRADATGYLKPGYRHVYVVSATGGAPRQLTFGAFNESGPISWSPDGQFLFVAGNRHETWRREPGNTEIFEVALLDGAIRPLTDRVGPDAAPAVSPDGSAIAYLGYDDKFLGYHNVRLHVLDRKTGRARSLTDDLDRTIEQLAWASDGRSLFVSYTDQAITKVARVHLNGRREVVAEGLSSEQLDRPYTGGEFSVAGNGTIAYTRGTPHSPSEVAITRKGRIQQLTHLNQGLFSDKTLAQVRPLPVVSSFDQRGIDAWLVLPPGFDPARKYPLILEIHGGPFAAYGPTFSTDNQLYAAAGYVVAYANPRGSTSYGAEFADLIHHNYPSQDYDDLISVVDAAIAQGFIDENALFVTGGSGGGTLTSWIVGRTHRFKAAATQKPVINWSSLVLTTDVYAFMARYWFGEMPWENPQAYWNRSPLSLVGEVKTPTLVVVGDRDLRTPVSDSEQYFQALQLRGVPTALVKVPGASHGGLTARPSQSAAKASAILAWFERYRTTASSSQP
jgi:dipeptidyl aminopeptidase/acylaminoacyl peptidase